MSAAVVAPPAAATVRFTANWWVAGPTGTHRMATAFPELHFGAAGDAAALAAPAGGELARLIGTTALSFPVLDSFNAFPAGHMQVSRVLGR